MAILFRQVAQAGTVNDGNNSVGYPDYRSDFPILSSVFNPAALPGAEG